MKYLTATIRRGIKKALKMLKVINDSKEDVINNCKDIESILISQNKKYYTKAINTKAYQDKVYDKLLEDDMRNRILKGTLKQEEYTYQDIYDFLQLLERINQYDSTQYRPIKIGE